MQFHQNHQSAPFLIKSTNHDGGWTFNIGRPLRGAGTMFYKVWRESNPLISIPTQPFWGILYRLYTSIHSIFGPLPYKAFRKVCRKSAGFQAENHRSSAGLRGHAFRFRGGGPSWVQPRQGRAEGKGFITFWGYVYILYYIYIYEYMNE